MSNESMTNLFSSLRICKNVEQDPCSYHSSLTTDPMGSRRKARECALQMLFAADVAGTRGDELARTFWSELADGELEPGAQEFATRLAIGTLANLAEVDDRIRSRAEHWRITRMALVDRNVLRLAVYEFLKEATPRTVTINEALEIARRFSSYEATQFINGILDAIKRDLDEESPEPDIISSEEVEERGTDKDSEAS